MKRSRRGATLLAVLGSPLMAVPLATAQQDASEKTVPAARILAAPAAAQEQAQEADDPVTAAITAFEDAWEKWVDEMNAAAPADRAEIQKRRPDPSGTIESLRALASEHAGTDLAAKALGWLASRVGDQDALAKLLEDHADSAAIADVLPALAFGQAEENEAHLRSLAKDSPHEVVRGKACFFLAMRLQREQREDEAFEWFEKVGAFEVALEDERFGELRERSKRELSLRIGAVAPDIVGPDTDGVEFKLSDYRGKVVLLDFWGHW